MSEKNVNVNVTGGGCLGCLVFIFAIWALVFGVTINGKWHGVSCTSDQGVLIE